MEIFPPEYIALSRIETSSPVKLFRILFYRWHSTLALASVKSKYQHLTSEFRFLQGS